MLLSPVFVKGLLQFLGHSDKIVFGIKSGYTLATFLCLCTFASILAMSQAFLRMYFIAVSVRACIMRAVFNKACRLTASARNSASVGEMTNLISNDVERIYFGIMISQQLWVGPLLIVGCLVMLLREIGPSGLFAVVLMISYVPLQGSIARYMGKMKRNMLIHSDERVKFMNEVLSGIRIVKMVRVEA